MNRETFDFHKGVQICTSEIKEWHQEVLNTLKKGGEYACKASGNSIVFGFRDSEGNITIREVTNGYIKYEYQ